MIKNVFDELQLEIPIRFGSPLKTDNLPKAVSKIVKLVRLEGLEPPTF